MTDKIDPDLLALALMVRCALTRIARAENSQDPEGQLVEMRQEMLEKIARMDPASVMHGVHGKRAMFDAILRLMPLEIDLKSRN